MRKSWVQITAHADCRTRDRAGPTHRRIIVPGGGVDILSSGGEGELDTRDGGMPIAIGAGSGQGGLPIARMVLALKGAPCRLDALGNGVVGGVPVL